MISDYADNQNVFYLDINKKFLDQQGNLRQELIPDLLHLNEKGYQIWAEAMEPMMRKLLNEEHTLPN
jgi:beta-glucosidase